MSLTCRPRVPRGGSAPSLEPGIKVWDEKTIIMFSAISLLSLCIFHKKNGKGVLDKSTGGCLIMFHVFSFVVGQICGLLQEGELFCGPVTVRASTPWCGFAVLECPESFSLGMNLFEHACPCPRKYNSSNLHVQKWTMWLTDDFPAVGVVLGWSQSVHVPNPVHVQGRCYRHVIPFRVEPRQHRKPARLIPPETKQKHHGVYGVQMTLKIEEGFVNTRTPVQNKVLCKIKLEANPNSLSAVCVARGPQHLTSKEQGRIPREKGRPS